MSTDPVACGVRHCVFAAEEHLQIEDFPVCGLHGGPLRDRVLMDLVELKQPGHYLSSSLGGPIVCAVGQLLPEHLLPWARRRAGLMRAQEHDSVRVYLGRTFGPRGWE